MIAKYAKDHPYDIASIYACRGEANQAFGWLEEAVQAADFNLANVQIDLPLAKLHADPRELPPLRKIGHAPEQLTKIKFMVTLQGVAGATSTATATSASASERDVDGPAVSLKRASAPKPTHHA